MKNLFSFIFFIAIVLTVIGFSSDEKRSSTISKTPTKKHTHISEKKSVSEYRKIRIFSYEGSTDQNKNASAFVTASSLLKISKENSAQALRDRYENIIFEIPVSEKNFIELEMTQSFPASENFTMIAKDGISNKVVSYTPGLHYSGIIKGKETSIASVSIFENFVVGILSDENGNYVLGSIKNSDNTYSDNYIFYNDADLITKNNFKCGVEDYEEKFIKPVKDEVSLHHEGSSDNQVRLPVKIYFEADNKMYTDLGNSTQAVGDFITAMFNSVKTIYQNENIPFEISQVGVWVDVDPYRNLNDSYDILLRFGANSQDDFQGNLAHLLSSRTAGLGGIAWIRVMCNEYNPNDSSGRFAFSNIDPNYNNFPTYSWTVNVITHEMGHSMGSRHTHACVWPAGPGGSIRSIDSCYTNENCTFTTRARIGTIMSYCHLWTASQGGGINLSSGFGPLPGDTIRLRYNQAACLETLLNSSERPTVYDLAQNFPNPFNPSTTISFALPKGSAVELKVFDVSGKLVADLINNKFYDTGFYDFNFNTTDYNLSSGIYFYSLISGGTLIDTKRMVLIK